MTGERDLRELLQHMTPQLHPDTFVFCTFPSCELPWGDFYKTARGISAGLKLALMTLNAPLRTTRGVQQRLGSGCTSAAMCAAAPFGGAAARCLLITRAPRRLG